MGERKNLRDAPPAGESTEAGAAAAAESSRALAARRSPNVAQAILLGSAVGQLALALVITIYLARILSPAAFGFFALVGTIFILARKFLDLGLSNVAARDIAQNPGRERPLLEGLIAYRYAAGIVLALAMFVFAHMQRGEAERAVLMLAGVVLLFTAPAALDPVFQVRQAQGGPALLNLAGGLLVLFGSVFFKRLGFAGEAFAVLLVIREAFLLIGTKYLADRLLGYRPGPAIHERELKAFLGPALIFGLASLVYTVYFNCDVFFVLALRGRDELGAYAAAFRPINPLLLLPWLLMVPMVPVLTAMVGKDRQWFVRQARSACAIAVGIGACGLVAGTLLAPDLVQLLYKGRYLQGALSCVSAFRWLAVALGMACVTTVLTASMLADHKEKVLLAIGTSALVANAAINLVLLRHYNFTAAALATALTELLYLVGALVAFRMTAHCSPVDWSAIGFLLPAIAVGIALRLLHGDAALRVTGGVVLGVLAVGAILLSSPARRFRKEMTANALLF